MSQKFIEIKIPNIYSAIVFMNKGFSIVQKLHVQYESLKILIVHY